MSDARPSRGLGSWATVFANVAVVGSIVFLGIEVRQNSRTMKAQARSEVARGAMELLTFGLPDSGFQNTIMRGQAGEALTPLEQRQYERYRNAWLRYWEDMHYQYRNGLYDEMEFEAQREAIRGALRQPGIAAHWCATRSIYSPEFAKEMGKLLTVEHC